MIYRRIFLALTLTLSLNFCRSTPNHPNHPHPPRHPPTGKVYTLTELFEYEKQKHSKELAKDWNCRICGKTHDTFKTDEIYSLPPLFFINLERGTPQENQTIKKRENLVRFPLENLNLKPYIVKQDEDATYDLFAVIIHSGETMYSGHYYAYVKDLKTSKWWLLNDSNASEVQNPQDIITHEAKSLFYRKRGFNENFEYKAIPFKGLPNIGNTCYMNAALQVLVHIPEFRSYFEQESYKYHFKPDQENAYKKKGEVATAYASFLKAYLTTKKPVVEKELLENLKATLAKTATQFADGKQHDSLEYLGSLLTTMEEELYLYKTKSRVRQPEDNGTKTDEELAEASNKEFTRKMSSIFFPFFYHQLKATLSFSEHPGQTTRLFETVKEFILHFPEEE